MKMSDVLNLLIFLTLLIVIYSLFFQERKTTVDVTFSDTTRIETTIKVAIAPVVFRNVPARIDTVLHPSTSGDVIRIPRASLDSIFVSEEGYRDTVSVQYLFPPVNTFSLRLGLQPRIHKLDTIIVKDKTISVDVPTRINWPVVGIATAVGVLLGKQLCSK